MLQLSKNNKNKTLEAIAITAKMKLKTSLTDVAFAVTDGELLSELGWNLWDTDRNLEEGLFAEGVMRDMILNSNCLKSGDILINDRGFISRDVINFLKLEKQVDTYVPAKKNMTIYQEAIKIAISQDKWQKHPNKKRKTQEICLIKDLGMMWSSNTAANDVDLCACVVHDKKDNEYYVFLTTDTSKTAKQIINTYELRPEIEEDYRQIKDFWKLEDFKSTKYNFITFHIVMTLSCL